MKGYGMKVSILRAALLAAPFFLAACGAGDKSAAAPADISAAAPAAKPDKDRLLPTDMILGNRKAAVTLIEYASLTCPVCGYVATEILPDIEKKYVDTGKVRLVFREFPTHNPKLSLAVSVLTRCAVDKSGPDVFFPLIDELFKTQKDWEADDRKPVLAKIFAKAGLKEDDLDACLQRDDLIALVNANARTGAEDYEIGGTPTFILNGKPVKFKTKEELDQKIAAAVAAAKK